ncbi:TerC/Alx family metal homeostasis membrane protein [Mycolicibacillus parakoreensis]|uniref:TerC/Alx family metal homeostasis membrane protein n=1 Tax=Mycolicibacillus parakoreensis TaxID=1069221 RepID=A0ABY3U1U3_9MYCO|nr:TerC/Alx family metal homeostasis membrane protein [Mycolicibacillus parakoreensis]MCV7314550.1 TerC/Alx family metal homeostasis membrane protein [Mycolicibacillus parakoreensis]ULN53119.1 TerC/Alx family metal homeostasis membrane protein [Mycolicibacillus parakoreensis]HLS00112.1 TerC/Alx family metal homeostasis membrane protein [Mycolicibacillus parakoreensis]
MHVSLLEWCVTVAVTLTVLLVDIVILGRRPRVPQPRNCALALAAYIGLAVLFGIGVWAHHGARYGMQFFAGWLTEYSLSVDNLFVFLLIMTSFKVPRRYQQEALLVGITLALCLRGIFIGLGALAIQQLSWVFYLFGVFLLYTGLRMARGGAHVGGPADPDDLDGSADGADGADGAANAVVRFARTHLRATDRWAGLKLVVTEGGRRVITPMFLVVVALGTTDVIFAMDSIPAVYGLTREPYLVFTANVFALMGLRQLFFLLGHLLGRLVYLSRGLAFILAFIAVKMLLHALRSNDLPFVHGGRPIPVPEIPTWVSLVVIVVTIVVTTVASIVRTRVLART